MKKVLNFLGKYIKGADKLLLTLCLVCSALSAVFLYIIHSTYPDMYGRRIFVVQVAATFVGLAVMFAISLVDYRTMTKLWFIHMPLCILFVLSTFIWGVGRAGADDKAWVYIFGISVQPAEFLKLSFIITFSAHIQASKENLNSFQNILLLILHALIPIGLVMLQGDDGSALVFLFIFAVMMFSAGVWYRYFVIGISMLAACVPIVWKFMMSNDQKLRFLVLFDDSYSAAVTYQQNSALKAIGSGGVWGSFLQGGRISYVPEMQNDMIFSFIGNALGFVGSVLILGLLLTIFIRILHTCKNSTDISSKVICSGIFGMFIFQTIVNIGMNLKIFPIVGITLPFFSAGGSSVLISYAAIGIVMSIYIRNNNKLFLQI